MHALIGRQRERALLEGAIERLAHGRGGTVLLAGEPGIGKTRLLGEAAALAARAGVSAVWGRASEVGGAPALWPWIEVVQGLVAERGADSVRAAAGVGAPLVARLVPALGGAGAIGGSQIESTSERFLLFDAVAGTLRSLAPMVVLLDDLHAADQASLLLLEHSSRALVASRVLLVGSFRPEDADAAPELARILWKVTRGATHVPLGRLAPDEAEALLAGELGREPGSDELAHVLAATEGSPLFVLEYGRLMRARGGHVDDLPSGVRHAIDARLERLPAATLAALARVSVLGRDAPVHLIGAVGVSPEELAPARAMGLVIERARGVVTFSHVLIREALYQRLPTSDAAALHLAVADALAAHGRSGSEIVHHLLQAGDAVSEARLVAAVAAASEELVQMLAFDDAAAFVGRILGQRPWGERARGELLAQLGSALVRAGRLTEGRQACIDAAAIARRLGDPELFTRAALFCGIVFTPGFVDERLVAILQEADALGYADVGRAARIKARLAAARQPARHPDEPVALALEAVALVRTIDDAGALRDVLAGATSALAYFADPALRTPLDEELHDLAVAAGDRIMALRALARLVYDELDRGDRARAEHHFARYEALAATLGQDRFALPGWQMRAMLAFLAGDLETCRAFERQVAAALPSDIAPTPSHITTLSSFSRAMLVHDTQALATIEARALEMARGGTAFLDRECGWVAAAAIAARRGDRERVAERVARLPLGSWAETEELTTMAWLVEPLLLLGERARAAALYERLARVGHRHHSGSSAMHMYEGPFALPLGRLAAGLDRIDEAERWFVRAVAECRRVEAPLLTGRALLELGELLARVGRDDEARVALGEALAIARRYTMNDVVRRAAETLARRAAVASAAPPTTSARGASAAAAGLEMRRDGELWVVAWADRLGRFRDSRGMQMLATLVARPGVEVPATLLDGKEGGADDGVEALDEAAIRAYRSRALDLKEALEEAEERRDAFRATRLREELDALAGELARGVGLGGRARKQGGQGERARVNVQRRLKDAIARIAEALPEVGRHLEGAVRTGTFCVYAPRRDA
ncbi:MAG: AAA family ATPase [Deltaproteobacteria bacterium]|nr:AAA family ATPase [Deltaproteobacteria bacterium]